MAGVALVFPYFRTRAATELLFPPLGLAALAAQLRRRGIETRVFDCTFSSPRRLVRELRAARPDIVGVSSMVSLTHSTLWTAGAVRASLPETLLIAGGPLPTVFPGRYTGHFDAVFRGEADVSFPRFCEDFLARDGSRSALGELPLQTYPGLFVRRVDLAVDNPVVHHPESDLRSFPPPDRGDFDHATYQREWRQKDGSRTTSIIVSLGCPYNCEFCSKPIFGSVVRHRDLDAVMAEVDELRGLGYDSLWIADDSFTLDLDYLREFCRRMRGRGLAWSCLSRADGITDGIAGRMREAGCRRVYLGLESGSDATLRLMRKHATVEDGVRATFLYRAAGIETAAFFIVGYPGEDLASIEATFELALSLPFSDISFNVPMPLPGSDLFLRLGCPDEGKDWTRENEIAFVYPSDIDEAWLRRRIDETLRAFAERRRGSDQVGVARPA